eukprot:UC4_evm1s732
MGKRRKSSPRAQSRHADEDDESRGLQRAYDMDDLKDDQDKFFEEKEKSDRDEYIALSRRVKRRQTAGDGAHPYNEDGEEEIEEEVFGEERVWDVAVKGSDDDDDDDDDDEKEDEEEQHHGDDDDDDDNYNNGVESYFNSSAGKLDDGEDDSYDEELEERAISQQWGDKKSTFYGTDFVDPDLGTDSEDEMMAEEEEAEALRMQEEAAKEMAEADFESLAAVAQRGIRSNKASKEISLASSSTGKENIIKKLDEELDSLPFGRSSSVEKVTRKNLNLTKEQRLDLLVKESPELPGLMQDFQNHFSECRITINPLLEKAENGEIELSKDEISYLKLKKSLLLSYSTYISFYLLMKFEGRFNRNHPCVKALVTCRKLWDKCKPMEEELEAHLGSLVLEAQQALLNSDEESVDTDSSETDNHGEEEDDTEEEFVEKGVEKNEESKGGISVGTHPPSAVDESKEGNKNKGKISKSSYEAVPFDENILNIKLKRKRSKSKLEVAKERSNMWVDDEENDKSQNSNESSEEDDDDLKYYSKIQNETEKKKAEKRIRKEALEAKPMPENDGRDEVVSGERKITYEMLKNKGLVASRKKEVRNPRKKYRNRYEKSLIKRKSQIRPVVSE